MFLKKWFRAKKKDEEQTREEEQRRVFVVDTNIFIHCVRFGLVEGLKKVKDAYVPWAVVKELMTAAQQAEIDQPELMEDVKRFAWREILSNRGWTREMILARESRCPYAESACLLVQKKVDNGEWKTIGTRVETKKWVDGFSDELKQQLHRADLEVLASCFMLVESDYAVVLITRDRRLREAAEKFGIQTQDRVQDRISE